MLKIIFVILFLLIPLPLAAKASFTVKAPPPWVQANAISSKESVNHQKDAESGTICLLSDHQYRVNAGKTERYIQRVQKIVTTSGLEVAAKVQLDFEPSYQDLIIHHIHILRGDQVIDAFKPGDVKIIQKEEELSSHLYNGELTALILLDDVRVGDVIDYAYSINGNNPVLGGRFTTIFYLAEAEPVELLRYRLLWPAGRSLNFRADGIESQASVRPIGNETEYVWERCAAPQIEMDDLAPSWYNPYPQIQLSEFADWRDVVAWAVSLYTVKTPASALLANQIADWKSLQQEDGILSALRFVQDDVRYMGIELGPYSHQPTSPSDVFARRFGDCKDKSLLLTTIFRALGVEAHPALVNADRGRTLKRWQPSPFAFDHVIVKAIISGKTYWFDPTISHQRGTLESRYNPPYDLALVIKEGNTDIEEIPLPVPKLAATPTTIIKENYRVTSYDEPAILEVVATYTSRDADEMRAYFAKHSRADIGRDFIGSYDDTYPNIEAVGLPQIQDDEKLNAIMVTEKYRLPRFWKDQVRGLFAGFIYRSMDHPKSISNRHAPLALTYPMSINQIIEVELPDPLLAKQDSGAVIDDAMRFDYRFSREGRSVRLNYELRTISNEVPLERFSAYLDTVDKIEGQLRYDLTRATPRLKTDDAVWVLAGVMILLVILAVPAIVIGLLIWKKSQKQKREVVAAQPMPVPPALGLLPETAIQLSSLEEIERYVSHLRCDCGNYFHPYGTPLKSEGLIYDGRRLMNITLKCQHCGRQRDWYFVRPQPRESTQLGNAEYLEEGGR